MAEHSDVVILVVGLNENLEGEEGDTGNSYASGDKIDLQLPPSQRALVHALAETDTPVICCMMTGSAMDLSFESDHFDSVLQVWYPGARGGKALAEILFGDASPSGKLCVTLYEDVENLPEFTDYSMKGRTYRYIEEKAQYPFGFGLTYGDVSVKEANILEDDGYVCHVTYENTGNMDTQEVIQIYVDGKSQDAPLHPRLCGFARITAKAGEKGEVKVALDPHTYEVVNAEGRRVPAAEKVVFYVGCSQPDDRSVELTGKMPIQLKKHNPLG